MNAETQNEVMTKEPLKSKRLSSFVWIVVLWGFVRLISEMDGISWERAFPIAVILFGLWPATLFLGLSIFVPYCFYQTIFRWAAFGSVISSLTTVFFIDSQSSAVTQIITQQRILVLVLLVGVAIHWLINRRLNK
jgi:hypothetical protein